MDDFEHRLRRTSAGMSYTDIPAAAAWCREQIQRQAISQAFDSTVGPPGYCKRWDLIHELKASGLAGEGQHARIILSDVDEIPDLTIFDQISPESPTVISWKQDLYYYWVNLKCWSWIGPVSCTWETFQTRFRGDMQLLRDSRASADCVIDGGWHFSYLGGAKAIREKIEAFSHTEYLDCASPENIRQALSTGWKENRDLFGREMMKFQLMPDDSHLPRYLRENKTSFCNWWFPSGQNV
jgi:beta-1,4-mannosyl-glycoprotein beta-1,4-N-acetylglucosaminyltransferase